jgi:hypothetical protein
LKKADDGEMGELLAFAKWYYKRIYRIEYAFK